MIKQFILTHKLISIITVITILSVGYFAFAKFSSGSAKTSYTTKAAQKGTITTTVSGSGQVAASNQLNLQFKSSGTLVYLAVHNGQSVKSGQLIAQLDTTDQHRTIEGAQSSLQSTQISLQKLEGSSNSSVPQNKQNAQNTLSQDYQTAYNDIANAFTRIPSIMTGLNTVLFGNTFNNFQQNIDFYGYSANSYDQNALTYRDSARQSYNTTYAEYTKNFLDYKTLSRSSDNSQIASALTETYNTAKDVSQALKDANNLIQFYKDIYTKYNIKINAQADTDLSTLDTYATEADGDVNTLLNIQNSITSDTQAVGNADLDLQSAQLNLQQQQDALNTAKQNLSNYFIYAPFDGVIGNVGSQKGDNVGSGTTVATIITNQKIATISLNEVDVSKIQTGQKVMITFDALPDLSVAGQVAQINPIGTVSQGVVTYGVQISFDTQDDRVKPGMSMTANIITNVKQDVIIVPNSSIKSQGNTKYVQVLVNGAPQMKIVTTGLSNETDTEITNGINVGDQVITQTISSKASTSSTGSTQRVGGFGGGLGGGTIRIGGGGGFRGN